MTDPRPQSAASAARRATGDPNRFVIPTEALPAGFTEKLEDPALTPVEARPAATVLLLRDTEGGLEALLLRRHKRSGFAAGAWVFPGGTVDEGDRDLSLVERLEGPTPMQWADRLGVTDPAEALAFAVAAVREAFEETGILLARVADDATNPGGRETLEVARRALLAGVVDATDRDLSVVDRLDGPTPSEWAARLGVDDPAEAVGYVVAALREAFEETGILLARDSTGAPVTADEALEVARRALLADVIAMREVIVGQDLRLAGDGLAYVAHWITPEAEPRRYDTRFFLARVDAEAVCTPHEAEMTESVWLTARGAVHYFELGSLKMLPPTVHTLRRLAGFTSVDEIFAALADAPVPMIMPVMRVVPDGVTIELPPEAR